MAVAFVSNKYVSNSFTLEQAGVEYAVTGSVAIGKPTADGSTIFNIDIPATYNYVAGTFKFYNSSDVEIAATITTPDTGKIKATIASGLLSDGASYKMTFDLSK